MTQAPTASDHINRYIDHRGLGLRSKAGVPLDGEQAFSEGCAFEHNPWRAPGLYNHLRDQWSQEWQFAQRHSARARTETQAPATPELVERLRSPVAEQGDPKAVYRTRPVALFEEAADALEAQQRELQGRRAQLDEVEQIAGRFLGYPWFKDDQKNFPGATEADGVCIGEHVSETIVEELRAKAEAQQARIAELEAVLRSARETILDLKNSRWSEAEGSDEEWVEDIDQALSSQGRHEGVTSGSIPELPGVNAVPLPASPDELLSDPHFVHLNMLRGGVAKLTPAQIGHLYRGSEAAEVIAEVMRQNPAVQPTGALYGLVNAARRHMATHPVFRTRRIGGDGSRARLEQEDQIASEDALRAAIQAALSPSHTHTNPKAGAPEHG